MALFQGKNTMKPDSRSRMGALQIGEHESPAEDWVTDPLLPVVLKNPYGGPGMEDVVVPMGRLIAVGEPVQVYTGKFKTTVTIANGTNPVIGVAPYNFVKDMSNNDRFGGNKPAIITNKYIRLPYIPSSADSDLCPWGHVTGDGITNGDYLKATSKGQFTKWDSSTDDINQRVGQILAKDFNQEVMGWMKMAMWEEQAKYDDEIFQNYYDKQPNAKPGYGYPYTQEYRNGTINMEKYGYHNQFEQIQTGIPGLTDGQGRSLTRFSNKALGNIAAVAAAGDTMVFQILDEAGFPMVDIVKSTDPARKFVLKVNGVTVTEGSGNGEYAINYKTGVITYKSSGTDDGQAVTADYCAYFYGTPSYFDFRGAIGVFNVLLKL